MLIRLGIEGIAVLIIIILSLSVKVYYQDYQLEKQARQAVEQNQKVLIKQINAVHQLDKQHSEALGHAQDTIRHLRADVESGQRQLCLYTQQPNRQKSTTTGMVNETCPRLSDTAERHYFTLRQRIVEANAQINGLQDYIKRICLSSK